MDAVRLVDTELFRKRALLARLGLLTGKGHELQFNLSARERRLMVRNIRKELAVLEPAATPQPS